MTDNDEIASEWDFDPAENGQLVEKQELPAVPGMVETVELAAERGYAVFFLAGRPTTRTA